MRDVLGQKSGFDGSARFNVDEISENGITDRSADIRADRAFARNGLDDVFYVFERKVVYVSPIRIPEQADVTHRHTQSLGYGKVGYFMSVSVERASETAFDFRRSVIIFNGNGFARRNVFFIRHIDIVFEAEERRSVFAVIVGVVYSVGKIEKIVRSFYKIRIFFRAVPFRIDD